MMSVPGRLMAPSTPVSTLPNFSRGAPWWGEPKQKTRFTFFTHARSCCAP